MEKLNGHRLEDDIVKYYKIGDIVRFRYVFLNNEAVTPLKPYYNVGKVVKIVENTRNPYLIDNDKGWVSEQVIEGTVNYLCNYHYTGDSLIDGLHEIGENISFESLRILGRKNGIDNYVGSKNQDLIMLKLLKDGKLIS